MNDLQNMGVAKWGDRDRLYGVIQRLVTEQEEREEERQAKRRRVEEEEEATAVEPQDE